MSFIYSKEKDISANCLQELFLANKWDSGNYPEKLKIAIANSDAVYTAWDDDKLVGLINCLSDGIMNVYMHYVLLHPDYQGKGIGKKLMNSFQEDYKSYMRKVVISYPESVVFYEKMGFTVAPGKEVMFLTDLTT